jgi:type IV fimbrial biogenesis protein FimT
MQASRTTPRFTRSTAARRGLSMIEACTVLALASVLAGSALTSWTPARQKWVFDAAVGEVPTDVNFARGAAPTRSGGVWLSYHPAAGGSCALVHAGDKADCTCDAEGRPQCTGAGEAIKAVLHPVPVSIAKPIHFSPDNGTVTPTATIRVQHAAGREVHHKVNILGRVRSCSPNGAVKGYSAC